MNSTKKNQAKSTTSQVAPTAVPAQTATSSAAPPAEPAITGTAADDGNVSTLDLLTAVQTLVKGLQANYQATDIFQMSIGTFTRDDIIQIAQTFIADCEDTKAKKLAWSTAVQTERQSRAQLRPARRAVHVFFQNLLGKESAALRTYGFEPQRPRQTSVKAKAAGQQKAEATRKAHEAPAAAPAAPVKS